MTRNITAKPGRTCSSQLKAQLGNVIVVEALCLLWVFCWQLPKEVACLCFARAQPFAPSGRLQVRYDSCGMYMVQVGQSIDVKASLVAIVFCTLRALQHR